MSATMSPAVVLHDGHVVDGSGAARFKADVRIENGRITAIGQRLSRDGAQTVDVSGRVITPGFIDVHTHDDHIVLLDPVMHPKISQGITTVVTGNCGISLAPLIADNAPAPLNLLGSAGGFRFPTFAAYATEVNNAHPAVNVAALVGHTTLRVAHVPDLKRKATADEIERMQDAVAGAMRDGAIGISTGVFYEPAAPADLEEMAALARVAARAGGIYATHIRDELDPILDSLREAFDTARAADIALVISHHKCAGPANWGRTHETLAFIDRARERQEIGLDAYPYVAGSTVLRRDIIDGVIDVLVTSSDPYPELAGRWLADIAQMWTCSQQEACDRLQPGGACYFQMHEDDVQRVLRHPATVIGSDGLPHDRHPHPRLWGTFPRVLGHYCRDLRLFDLETAVHKMSGQSAARFGLHERGLVKIGYHADLVVLDPATVADRATFTDPKLTSAGIDWVFVNGVASYRQGNPLAQRAGRFLAHGK